MNPPGKSIAPIPRSEEGGATARARDRATQMRVDPKGEEVSAPALAAILAACLGTVALGILSSLVQAAPALRTALTLNPAIGPLSGQVAAAVVTWLVSWASLALLCRARRLGPQPLWLVAAVLKAAGLIAALPLLYGVLSAR